MSYTETNSLSPRAEAVLEAMQQADNLDAVIFPMEDGSTRFYWAAAENKMTIDVSLDGEIYIHAADLATGTYRDETIPADADPSSRLAVWLR